MNRLIRCIFGGNRSQSPLSITQTCVSGTLQHLTAGRLGYAVLVLSSTAALRLTESIHTAYPRLLAHAKAVLSTQCIDPSPQSPVTSAQHGHRPYQLDSMYKSCHALNLEDKHMRPAATCPIGPCAWKAAENGCTIYELGDRVPPAKPRLAENVREWKAKSPATTPDRAGHPQSFL